MFWLRRHWISASPTANRNYKVSLSRCNQCFHKDSSTIQSSNPSPALTNFFPIKITGHPIQRFLGFLKLFMDPSPIQMVPPDSSGSRRSEIGHVFRSVPHLPCPSKAGGYAAIAPPPCWRSSPNSRSFHPRLIHPSSSHRRREKSF